VLALLLLAPSIASAQGNANGERRIALVIGNAAYQAGALATPANDAGLIAQTLQAAGFDVAGARDLDQDSMRRALRDFVEKAQASGPNTVAYLYFAGYGLQLEGENYLVPVDARLARDSDIPLEAIRVSDYLRPLAGMRLKATIVVLDAARANTFAKAGAPLAGGLALVEPGRAGVSLRPHATLDPTCRFHEVTFRDVVIVRDDIVGGEPSPESVQRLFDVSGMIAATEMTGIAAKVLDTAIDYAGKRTQFDKPIGSFQAIKHRCADMAVAVDASRSAAYYAAWALAEASEDRAKAVSMAKSYCGDAARFACNEGIQIHGGIGFTWELGLHYYLRRAKVLEYSFGDAAYHRERVLTSTLAQLAAGA